MLTPLSQPSFVTAMNSSAVPWNHVAIMRPSSCQTVRKRSQSPASRHTAQFSTSSRIARRSFAASAISSLPSDVGYRLGRVVRPGSPAAHRPKGPTS